ncbi:Na+/H+ antiporter NhaA [Sphingomonas sp. ID0503]|uniref:Na+/H+ antiporter NhaA n=1 Tax=Sphingomonas sp. ID0503 TaxID=3399691 RepID=UPI003AFB303B
MTSPNQAKPQSALRAILTGEAAGGIVLVAAAMVALVIANSGLSETYFGLLHVELAGLSALHWINDGLMALFFLLVGLELKRELLDGQLSTWSRRTLPLAAAVAGMAVPAIIYIAVNRADPVAMRGWAVPTATDIAFGLGVLALIGSRVPVSLKVLLTAIAVIDDLGAIIVIALFYTSDLSPMPLFAAALGLVVLVGLNRAGVRAIWPYLLIGLGVWYGVLLSGVHATLAGVAVALTVPITCTPARPEDTGSPLHRLEHALHPWIAYAVLPIFAVANAGVDVRGLDVAAMLAPVPLAIAAGLFAGKQLGVFGLCWALIRANIVDKPAHASWAQLYGMAVLCGIGFTMSLFIGGLAFGEGPPLDDAVKIGVLVGSVASALVGYAVLRWARREC